MEEKRKYIRVPLAVKVTNVRTKEFHFFYSKDISMGGMFLETKDPYPVGTEVELDFFLPIKDSKERLVIPGKVTRVQHFDVNKKEQPIPGMGIEFSQIEPAHASAISNFIRFTLGVSE